jgi:sugar-specific transcriptional regulator TrmB
MLNNKNIIVQNLKKLGLTPDEAKVYVCLLDEPMSHLEIARKTGVNRTKVYRIADELIKRGLIKEEMSDEGRELAAAEPDNLEIALTTAEQKLQNQKQVLKQTLPALKTIFEQGNQPKPTDFVVNSYEGVDGFKQMLWNELKTEGEILVYCFGTIQDLVDDLRWAERHREKTLEAGYVVREIINPGGKPEDFTNNTDFVTNAYRRRHLDSKILPIIHQFVIYNNTVSIYNWQNGQKVGAEIINKDYADMQRAIFEHYWQLAK